MNNYNEIKMYTGQPEYSKGFWNAMRGEITDEHTLRQGRSNDTGAYVLPSHTDSKLSEAIKAESFFRQIATTHKAYSGASRILAKDSEDIAAFIPENGSIPIFDGMNDFTPHLIESQKLATFIKLDTDFVHDTVFDLERYLVSRLAKNFAKGEEQAFITGTGIDEPTGILHDTKGAEIALSTEQMTYTDILSLYFSVKPEYRSNGVWLMNDETALALRSLKDDGGNVLWRDSDDTLLGKKIISSAYMTGEKPIAFGDFSYYWIVDRSPVTIKALTERFVLNGQIGYLAITFLDGKLIRKDAIKVLQITP